MREFFDNLWDFVQAWAVLLTLPVWMPVLIVLVGLFPGTFMRVTEGRGWKDVWVGLGEVSGAARGWCVLATLGVVGLHLLAILGLVGLWSHGDLDINWTAALMLPVGLHMGKAVVDVWVKE